uniref:VceA n=1 Tax=Vibrio cholerae TaxID=666 RepID=O51918_VIBCL|nr:VceA [Vibrio cholerae]
MNSNNSNTEFDGVRARQSRKKGFLGLAAAIVVAGGSYALYWHFIGSRYISTDNAYAAAEIAEVTPAVGRDYRASECRWIPSTSTGDVLVQLDDTDARLALLQAEADLALAKRRVRSYLANDEGLSAMVEAQEANEQRVKAQLKAAQADFERAKIDLSRREDLVASGSVSGEELTNAKTGFAQAQANLNAAKAAMAQAQATKLSTIGSQKANAALTDNTTVDSNPEVLLAKARYEQAKIDLERTVIRAPISGIVAKRQVQVGRRVQVGMPLMTVVPTDHIYVDANFKEVELRDVKVGQPVTLTADLYGDDVTYHGVVAGFSGGTGSAFSMIPAQNATGNWIKVVQRLPIRIELDPKDLQAYPLQVGLSMVATIDTAGTTDPQTLVQYRAAKVSEQG